MYHRTQTKSQVNSSNFSSKLRITSTLHNGSSTHFLEPAFFRLKLFLSLGPVIENLTKDIQGEEILLKLRKIVCIISEEKARSYEKTTREGQILVLRMMKFLLPAAHFIFSAPWINILRQNLQIFPLICPQIIQMDHKIPVYYSFHRNTYQIRDEITWNMEYWYQHLLAFIH